MVSLHHHTEDSQAPPLIDADQDMGDNWLIDDIGSKATKRKLGDVDAVFKNPGTQQKRQRKSNETLPSAVSQATQRRNKTNAIESDSDTDQEEQVNLIQTENSETNAINPGNIGDIFPSENAEHLTIMESSRPDFDMEDFDLSESQDITLPRSLSPLTPVQSNNMFRHTSTQLSKLSRSQKGKKSHQTKLTAFGVSHAAKNMETVQQNSVFSQRPSTATVTQHAQNKIAMRLRVSIKDKTILVPVPQRLVY